MNPESLISADSYIVPHWYMYPTKGMYSESNFNRGLIKKELNSLKGPINIYIHIPFCNMKCSFCTLYTTNRDDISTIEKYLNYLTYEIELLCEYLDTTQIEILNLYIGGGTPSTLRFEQVEVLIKELKKSFKFNENICISAEFSPDTINVDSAVEWRRVGLNRSSIGIQSFNEDFLKDMNRNHSGYEGIKAINMLKEAGFDNINVDLIYGHENQSENLLIDDLDKAVNSGANCITLHPLANRRKSGYSSDPKNQFQYDLNSYKNLFSIAIDFLKGIEWTPTNAIAFSNSNAGHKIEDDEANGTPTIGIGAGSRTYLRNIHKSTLSYSNKLSYSKTLNSYFNQIDSMLIPIQSQVILSEEEVLRRKLVLSLVSRGIKKSFLEQFNKNSDPLSVSITKQIEYLKRNSFVEESDLYLSLTKFGQIEAAYAGSYLSSSDMKKILGFKELSNGENR